MSELEPRPLSKAEYVEATGVSGNEIIEDKDEALEVAGKLDEYESKRAAYIDALELLGDYYSNLPDSERMIDRSDSDMDGPAGFLSKVLESIAADADQRVIDGTLSEKERERVFGQHDVRIVAARLADNLYKWAIKAVASPRIEKIYNDMGDKEKSEAHQEAREELKRETRLYDDYEPSQEAIKQYIFERIMNTGYGYDPHGTDVRSGITNDEIMEAADSIVGANITELDEKINSIYETGKTPDQHNRFRKVQEMLNKYKQRNLN